MDIMPPKLWPSLLHEKTRHGAWVWYVRVGKGPRIRIRATFGTEEFKAEYHAAVIGQPLAKPASGTPYTLRWAIDQYLESPAWRRLAAESRKQMSYQFTRIKERAGDELLSDITRRVVLESRDARDKTPSDANKYVRATNLLFEFAISKEWADSNPAKGIAKLPTSGTGEGFHTWTEDEMLAFEKRWPIGTMQRLAFEIIRCTGLRRGDVHAFGSQHIRKNTYVVRTSKTGQPVTSTILPQLRRAIDATKVGDMTFLLTSRGTPFKSKAAFGNWFKAACVEAGVPGSAHGIRKALASEIAELGKSEAELNSFFGWAHGSRESATYIQKADRARMAKEVSRSLARTTRKGAGKNPAND
ncbi:site-specific integrase [Aestuariivirga sp.]|uniref:site-specific integrase n=1 Tax=Aestuariivirga sp. TaxID=2650926 RepID=UPI0039E6DE08